MAFPSQSGEDDEVMHEINMTPLVDVMLVLLIIFMITIPVMNHSVAIELPRASSSPQMAQPRAIHLAIDAQGRYHWNTEPVDSLQLSERMRNAAIQDPQPDLHLRADRAVPYERVAKALAAAQRAGLRRVGFVTEPEAP